MLLRIVIFLLIIIVFAGIVYLLCRFAGAGMMWLCNTRRNYGHWVGCGFIILTIFIVLYGYFIGFTKLDVRHISLTFDDLPSEFDGYKIVQISDAHLGTYCMVNDKYLMRNVDSINAQNPDVIVFTGDIQNIEPSEIVPQMAVLKQLHAKDGIYSVLGNHDYPIYARNNSEQQKKDNLNKTIAFEREMGWNLLLNANVRIVCDSASIVIAGMENDGDGIHFPMYGNISKTLSGVSDSDFVVMLQHDPTHWRDRIIPQSNAQLTLSGHTHAGQFMLFGWSPVKYVYQDWNGLSDVDGHILNVSVGMGGVVPFRFGVSGEICVITLHSGKK